MRISELLSFMAPKDWVWVANRHGQVFYGWAMHVPESVGDLEVGTVSGDQNIGHIYVGTAYNVPDCLRDLRVIGVRATDWMVDIEVCDV